ncbi:hypothetical protein [Dermatophilus congolensis]|uniref:hypothetical protein n=1 Tax=Dermatophilus congolensis TaxID=1863 RepID=UPI003C7DFBC5
MRTFLYHLPASPRQNPLQGIRPNFNFTPEFNSLIQKVFSTFWGLSLLGTAFFLLLALSTYGKGKHGSPTETTQAKERIFKAVVGVIFCAAFSVIFGLLLWLGDTGN